jgi:hypothetical protein
MGRLKLLWSTSELRKELAERVKASLEVTSTPIGLRHIGALLGLHSYSELMWSALASSCL